MSKKKIRKTINRERSKNATTNKEYKVLSWIIDPGTKWDEDYWICYPRRKRGTSKYWKKQISNNRRRECRSWKYNRKTQYKDGKG